MSLNEIALPALGIAAGAAGGAIGTYLYFRRSFSKNLKSATDSIRQANSEDLEDRSLERLVSKSELEKTRRELRTLTFEKELVSAALTRLYEAEVAQEITREERETLGIKYREELKALDEKILKIDSFIEVGDLETLREQLLGLVEQKIDAIEKRIKRARLTSGPMLAEITRPEPLPKSEMVATNNNQQKTQVPDISNLLANQPEKARALESSSFSSAKREDPTAELKESEKSETRKKSSDPQVDELQKELLEALDRLQKLDIEN